MAWDGVLLRILFSFETIAAGATFRIAVAGIAYVDFAQGAIVARAVVFAFCYTTTDCRVHFAILFVHHSFCTPYFKLRVHATEPKVVPYVLYAFDRKSMRKF